MYKKSYCIILITILSVFTLNAQQKDLDSGRKYTINQIKVTGAQNFNEQTVVAFTGLKKGDRIYIPGEKLSQVTKKLWEQGLFSDIAFYVTNIDGENVDLELYIVELPKLNELSIEGAKKGKIKEIIKDNDLKAGTKITNNLLNTTKNYIRKKYQKDGYFNTEVNITNTPHLDSTGVEISQDMKIEIDKGSRVKVQEINFEGNTHFTDTKLRRVMKKTKQKNYMLKVKKKYKKQKMI